MIQNQVLKKRLQPDDDAYVGADSVCGAECQRETKKTRLEFLEGSASKQSPFIETEEMTLTTDSSDRASNEGDTLCSYPFFYYKDYSNIPDPDPMVPLTVTGKVPNFPAKMHAILSRKDLQDVVSWMPHGRSWRVHKPREFEVRVIPVYFEHVKFSSFVRQANGWGFHRITVDSRDRNSYYHPMFLRGLPHLCKDMKRPGPSKKQTVQPEHEPDLYEISKLYPVPDKVIDDSVLLPFTLTGGPKALMPILSIDTCFSNTLTNPVSGQKSDLAATNGQNQSSETSPRSAALLKTFKNIDVFENKPVAGRQQALGTSFGSLPFKMINTLPGQGNIQHQAVTSNPLAALNPTSTFEAGYYAGIQHHQNTHQKLMYAASRASGDGAVFGAGKTDTASFANYAYKSQSSCNAVQPQQFYHFH